ncbi:hypothetical protein BKP42_68010 [Rhodococcus erythropolis]|nr:hypothetical protein BKP42_68010 [Rhodococcus erythropolis]
MSRVHRKECRTGLGNGPHRQNGLDRAWKTQRHHRFGTHSRFDQQAGQSVRLCVEFEIGHFTFLEHERDGAGILGGRHICCCSEHIRKALNSGGDLTSHGYQFDRLTGGENLDISDPRLRIRGDALENPLQAVDEAPYCLIVKNICGITEFGANTVRFTGVVDILGHRQLQIEVDGVDLDTHVGHLQLGEFQGRSLDVLELQHDLKQGRVCRRA